MLPVSLSILLQSLSGIMDAVLPFLAVWLAKEAITFFHISSSSSTAARIAQGVDALSDMALAELHTAASAGATVSVNATVAKVLNTASAGLLSACTLQGTTPEALAARVTGSLIAKASSAPPVVAPLPAVNSGVVK